MDTTTGEPTSQTNSGLIARTNPGGLSRINLFDEKQLAAAELLMTKIMRSDKGGIKSKEDGLAILMRAQDLGLPFSTSIEHIHVINGKTGIDIHIVKALMLKAACTWKCTKDYQALYEYTDGINVYNDGAFPNYVKRCISKADAAEKAKADVDGEFVYVYPVIWYKDNKNNVYKNYQLDNKFAIAHNRQEAEEVIKAGKTPIYRIAAKPIDYVTEYEITRIINGEKHTATGRFSYSEAIAAGMFEKDTYKKYPRILIGHRAFTYAAREIASDVLFGVMETTELKIVSGQELDTSDVIDITDAEVIDVE